MARENARPDRVLAGQKTLLSRTMHDIRYDEVHDELVVTNPFAQAILVFRGGASGEDAPIRVIQGPHTLLTGSVAAGIDRVEVDPIHNEILVPSANSILVFPRDGNGDVAPLRILKGPDTNLGGARSVAVDPVNNRMVVGGSVPFEGKRVGGLLIFDRTANGNVKPLAMIGGPKSGIIRIAQLQTYGPKGWIVAAQQGANQQEPEGIFVGIWSINGNGDVPPRWKIGGPKSMLKRPRGVVLDAAHQEMIVSDMRVNGVLTYSFPELFQ